VTPGHGLRGRSATHSPKRHIRRNQIVPAPFPTGVGRQLLSIHHHLPSWRSAIGNARLLRGVACLGSASWPVLRTKILALTFSISVSLFVTIAALGITRIGIRSSLANRVHLWLLCHRVRSIDVGIKHLLLTVGAWITLDRAWVHGRLAKVFLRWHMLPHAVIGGRHLMLSVDGLGHAPGRHDGR